MEKIRVRMSGNLVHAYKRLIQPSNRVLIIGDLHAPFIIDGYLDFCIKVYKEYSCNQVVFIGDILDNHYASYHETDPNGLSGGEELEKAKSMISNWYRAFPEASVTIGNHDLLIMRKAQTSSVPKEWIKSFSEVLEVPGWNFIEEIEIDNVLYTHGIGSKAHVRAKNTMQSVVQGHHHTDCYVQWFVGKKYRIFAMQVGCGVDIKTYGMAYAKHFAKPAIACGVVEDGVLAKNILMKL